MDFPRILLLVGVVLTVIAGVTWRSGGKNLALTGATFIAFGGYMMTPGAQGAMRNAWLAAWVLLVLATFATSRRADWRRAEILLLAAAAIVLWTLTFLEPRLTAGGQVALMVLLVVLAGSAIFLMFRPLVAGIRAARPK